MKTLAGCFTTLILICLVCCKSVTETDTDPSSTSKADTFSSIYRGNIIADTIIYDVIIKNPNQEDTWTNQCLHRLKRKEFIDQLFESIYKGETKAFDIVTQNLLTPNDIKKLENTSDFNRDKIGKIQFVETWYYDPEDHQIYKKVISASLGYEVVNSDGDIFAYRPVFRVFYN